LGYDSYPSQAIMKGGVIILERTLPRKLYNHTRKNLFQWDCATVLERTPSKKIMQESKSPY
jgi:hypothetical protein